MIVAASWVGSQPAQLFPRFAPYWTAVDPLPRRWIRHNLGVVPSVVRDYETVIDDSNALHPAMRTELDEVLASLCHRVFPKAPESARRARMMIATI
jgi:hypothetical protein